MPAPPLRVPAATQGDDACDGAKTLATVVAGEVLSDAMAGLLSRAQFQPTELPVALTLVEVVLPAGRVVGALARPLDEHAVVTAATHASETAKMRRVDGR
ncbi:MAG TPA: hypothetical protein VFV02_06365 [Acidimicrobiales bacterium]|nr:hypothetical protein [Acidimicrobiales bacterium]